MKILSLSLKGSLWPLCFGNKSDVRANEPAGVRRCGDDTDGRAASRRRSSGRRGSSEEPPSVKWRNHITSCLIQTSPKQPSALDIPPPQPGAHLLACVCSFSLQHLQQALGSQPAACIDEYYALFQVIRDVHSHAKAHLVGGRGEEKAIKVNAVN